MGRTRAISAAAISLSIFILARTPCLAQAIEEPQANATGGTAAASQGTAALSPGRSLFWSEMHAPPGTAAAAAQNVAALNDSILRSNQRRYCGIIYLGASLVTPDNGATGPYASNFDPCR